MTTIYLIRHAEAEGNIFRRLDGQYDARLTANGRRQLEALAKRFSEIPLEAVYASDLYRTRQTALAVAEPNGLTLRLDPRFREVGAGIWEDRPFGEIQRTMPEQYHFFSREPEKWSIPEAETYAQYSARFALALTQTAEAHPGGTIAVVSHGCVISGGLHRLLGLPHNASTSDNTAVSLLRYEGGVFRAEYLFDNSHLSPAISTRARQRWWREQGGRFNLWFRHPTPGDEALYDPAHSPRPGDRVWIAMLEEDAVGYLSIGDRDLGCLWLKPEYRHRRYGDQLLGQAVVSLRARGLETLRVGVPTANLEAVAFFAHHDTRVAQMDDVYTVYEMTLKVEPAK